MDKFADRRSLYGRILGQQTRASRTGFPPEVLPIVEPSTVPSSGRTAEVLGAVSHMFRAPVNGTDFTCARAARWALPLAENTGRG